MSQAQAAAEVADEAAIRAAVAGYVEGWFDGDAGRMAGALHPELVKRSLSSDDDALKTLTAQDMIDATADGDGRNEDEPDRKIAVDIVYSEGGIAAVTCLCHRYVDLLHLIQTPEGWRIVNVVWRPR